MTTSYFAYAKDFAADFSSKAFFGQGRKTDKITRLTVLAPEPPFSRLREKVARSAG